MALTLPPDFKEFLRLLKEHDVRYLLIGGNVIDLENLKKNKNASGRTKDKADLEELP